ncbi:L-selectin-like isoform X1 [Ranitomeya variabilis]|uniref:L-selectin-like isoform X1 n=1 Tax=Ranitomeya variabilis TaxID=490064 RepID=UPI004055B9F7
MTTMNLQRQSQPYGCVWQKSRIFTLLLFCNGVLMFSPVNCWTYHYSKESMEYEQARLFCQSNYTDLVAIQNRKEIEYLETNIPHNPTYYWIGIRKINNTWTWVGTNKTLTDEAKNWGAGEPNNRRHKEDCVEIYIKRPKDSGKWNDDGCYKKKRALCYTASCDQLSCNGHGECIETINNSTCDCAPGFYGSQCQYVVQCQHLTVQSQGYMNCSHPWGNFSFQSSCLYECFDGFFLNGKDQSQCLSSGTWSSAKPNCTAVTCEVLSPPENGSFTCNHTWAENSFASTCEITCSEGWKLKGPKKTACSSKGQWTEEIPECEAVTCDTLNSPPHGSYICNHPWNKNSFGSTCEFTCSEGWNLKGPNKTTCSSKGQWTEYTPECEEQWSLDGSYAQERLVNHKEDHRNAVFIIGVSTATSALSLAMIFWVVIRRLKKDKKKIRKSPYYTSDSRPPSKPSKRI